jgi:hypothetical protein
MFIAAKVTIREFNVYCNQSLRKFNVSATKVTVENWKVNAAKVTVRKLNVYCSQSHSKKVECFLQPKLQVRKLYSFSSQSYSKKV